ncbi:DUF342 domain-containing protein [Catenovulum adriaticum]|uniref:FapA family protein n=1 Tax=Catenovulum adriaticum TaxID=2984846 RepID=A0ABY7ANM6_9ALTE|nr:FapA family protein [Catenovulum sp. TS8]WAJ71159.1 FapA family protein [Catenovulum sp. TS8]
MSELAFEFDKNNNKLLLISSCIEGEKLPTDAIVREQFEQSKFQSLYYLPEEASKAVALLTQYMTAKQFGKPVRFVVAEVRPAKIKIRLSADNMSATAELTAAFGGQNLTDKQIVRCAAKMGVVMGLDLEAIKGLAKDAQVGSQGKTYQKVIAKGQMPLNGNDSTFERLTKTATERVLQPQETDNGKVDMRDLGSLVSVKPNDPLMRRHPPTKGRAGFDVKGNAVLAQPGECIAFDVGPGAVVSSEDSNLLVAEIPGIPYILEQGARVDNVLELEKVDVSTGHINFEGGVIVNGDVSEGMKLKASGNVTVGGFIENASIEIDGDLTVMKGIIGRKISDDSDPETTDYHCNVKVSGNLCAKYIQNSALVVKKQVQFQGQILHSRIFAQSIYGGTEKAAVGKIVGGFYEVTQGVRCATIGALASTNTTFHLFPELAQKQDKKQTLLKLRKEKEDILSEIKAAWEFLREGNEQENKAELIEQTINSYKVHDKELKKYSRAVVHLTHQIEKQMHSVYIQASREFFSKTHLKLGQVHFVTQDDLKNVKYGFRDGQFTRI